MKIAVYGCSWAAGVPFRNNSLCHKVNWVKQLSEMYPQHTFYNYARGGFSLGAILYLFDRFSKNYDLNIVKLTVPGRFILFDDKVNFELINKNNENYYSWTQSVHKDVLTLNPRSTQYKNLNYPWDVSNIEKFHKLLFTYQDIKVAKIEAIAISEYLKNRADFIFKHQFYQPYDVPSTEENIEDFKKYVFDDGDHLDINGCTHEALWIKKNIQEFLEK